MKKYVNKKNGKVAIIISEWAAGMCRGTIGKSIVAYKYEGDERDYPFIMERIFFFEEHFETELVNA